MKRSDSTTEMERLLRRYAGGRGSEALRASGGAQPDAATAANAGSHLDADEMNAYAEGALPEAARSRYFAHLADCDSCRKLVTELTLAASLAEEGKARVASLESMPSKSWRERLAAIFSPPVLKYAVPALALFAVIIVAIVAMRTNRKESGVALNAEQSRYSSSPSTTTDSTTTAETNTATGAASNHSNSNVAPLGEEPNQAQPRAAATPPSAEPRPMEDSVPVLSQNTIPRPENAQPADATKNSPGEAAEIAARREQQDVAAAPAPPPPAKTTAMSTSDESNTTRRDKREEQKKNKVDGKDDNDEMRVGGKSSGGTIANQRAANETQSEVGRTASAPAATRAAQGQSRKRPAAAAKSGPAATDMASEKEGSGETRSVGGRRFRRQGSAWVDTAYNSSRPTTNVARGSEQYRALVADEPTLRTIAEQLGGEVLVVWKSRAYRFY